MPLKKKMFLYRAGLITALFCMLCCLSVAVGCSSFSRIKRIVKSPVQGFDGGLKKQVCIAPFNNTTFFQGKDLEALLQNRFVETMASRCSGILLKEPGEATLDRLLKNPPRLPSGRIDNIALAKAGQQIGMNAFVLGSLTHISEKQDKKGILWFKEPVYYVQMGIRIEIYDSETGSKLMDEGVVHEIEVDEVDTEAIREKKQTDIPGLLDALVEIGEKMAEQACKAIAAEQWKGYIIGISGEKLLVSAGRKAGLKEGDRFTVYSRGKPIEGEGGQQFFLPGTKCGEIKITALYPEKAEAVVVSGDVPSEGASIRKK